jgi:hypothetical protein
MVEIKFYLKNLNLKNKSKKKKVNYKIKKYFGSGLLVFKKNFLSYLI